MPSININGNPNAGRMMSSDEIMRASMRVSAYQAKSQQRGMDEAAAAAKNAYTQQRRDEWMVYTAEMENARLDRKFINERNRAETENVRLDKKFIQERGKAEIENQRFTLRAQQAQHTRTQRRVQTGIAAGVSVLSGDFAPLGASIGEGLGGILGGPAGAIIGGLIGENLVKAVKGLFVDLPMMRGELMSSAMGLAQPAVDFTLATRGMGRAGGFSGSSLYDSFVDAKKYNASGLYAAGVGPAQFNSLMGAYGVMPNSSAGAQNTAIALQNLGQRTVGFGGMDPSTAARLAGQGVGMGLAGNSGTGASSFVNNTFGEMLTTAVQRGMDRATILGNMQGALDTMARNGAAGISGGAFGGMAFMSTLGNAPGARTGGTAASVATTWSGIAGNLSQNPMINFGMAQNALSNYGGLKTESDIKRFVGDKAWDSVDPGQRDYIVQRIMGVAKDGNVTLATQYASSGFLEGNPSRLTQLSMPAIKQAVNGNENYVPGAVSASTQGRESISQAFQMGYGASFMSSSAYDPKKFAAYNAIYGATKLSAGDQTIIQAAAARSRLDPVHFLALMGEESSLNPNKGYTDIKDPKTGLRASSAYGAFQVLAGTAADKINPDTGLHYTAEDRFRLEPNANMAAQEYRRFLDLNGGDVAAADKAFGADHAKVMRWQSRLVINTDWNGGAPPAAGNDATAANQANAKNSELQVASADYAFRVLVPAAMMAADALTNAGTALRILGSDAQAGNAQAGNGHGSSGQW